MINIEEQRSNLSQNCEEMLNLCKIQVENAYETFIAFDTDLAEDVIIKETRINALDLKIEKDTDQFIALYNPVATDLRFALALLKINYNLERIGDHAFDVANLTINLNQQLAPEILEKIQFDIMFETLNNMFSDVILAYQNEDLKIARKVFKKDKIINHINLETFNIVADEIGKNQMLIRQYLMALVVMKKFEKIGDLLKHISENIIYYIDAKLVIHKKKKK
ncbi:MAG: phosphate transport system regulatory protein PhoU [Flavobacteriales bacterium CG03_land_8_20_14_0_80_35_15]|nr:phosphate signaling complex protein PhoU [Zetaproteobacteria bacterium]OIO11770.1 MAG: phosphate transport system regulatory protein PhoU [Flavobacteriaceae bacterium CG1_02_35_72]PIR14805.1 MAG: phosphate transport system regulatory protein PhoU [Flavobacteriales bacterium CG11_big_fil_rev_8_21_14_0_20_35_7]PIV16471.1 MAG: phosphate transport system regulatory protein PhoU [Flavobacteriales bacterium CG03_land_8_20_14_0_80_35_15]